MPRPRRLLFANQYNHLLNRPKRGADVFHDSGDYHAFLGLINRTHDEVVHDHCLLTLIRYVERNT